MTPHFLSNASQAGRLLRERDWSTSPLGAPQTWPAALSMVVGLILESKFPMFVAWGPELGFLYNDAYIDVLGAKHPAAFGMRFADIWHEIWPALAPVVDDALAGRATYFENLPLLMNRKGHDEQTWFTFSYSPVHDEHGTVGGMYCACTETTGQVLAEQNRLAENERLKNMFQQAPGYIVVLRDADHVFELVNDSYYRLVGRRQLVGKPIREALPEVVGQGFVELLDGVYRTGEPYVGHAVPVRLQRETGQQLVDAYVDFVYQPIRDARGSVTGIFVEGSDVTESVRATQAIRASEAQLRQLANTIPHLAWMANPDGHVHWYNDRWYAFTGTALEQVRGWGWQDLIEPAALPLVVESWQASLDSGDPWERTFPIRSAQQEFRTFYSRAAPLRDADGKIVQWFGTYTDVTEINLAQVELKAANARKDEFLAMLAHELRNPLAPISTAAELLNMTSLDEARVKRTAGIIARQVTHMTKLVDDLLDVSRVTRGLVSLRADVLDMNDLVTEAMEQVQAHINAKKHRLTVRTLPAAAYVRGDRTRLIQVMSNLLNNAARYTPANGHIAVEVTSRADKLVVGVSDNGIGLAPDLTPHIFELFTQGERSSDRGQGGLGLGLALVKSLVELHAGTVSVSSAGPGAGSHFEVTLPRVSAEGTVQPPRSDPSELPRAEDGLALMVVDDNEDAAQMLSLLLQTIGHRVWVAHDAQAALAAVQDAAPAILFLDIGLPDMDGYELARRLRALPQTASAVLVAVTGYGQPEDRERAFQAGFDHHLVKPVKMAAVLSLIDSVSTQP